MVSSRRVVIVGASLGGLRSAEALRSAGFDGQIDIVGAEPHLPYNRPPLSKDVLANDTSFEAVAFRLRPSVADVTWILGREAVSLDARAKVITLDDGRALAYDALIVATGLRPRRLTVAGPDVGRHVLRTIDDATALKAELAPGRKVIVAGSGFVGCETAATARKLGCDVSVVSFEEWPMERVLGETLGKPIRQMHERNGVVFYPGKSIARFHGTDRISSVELSDGTILEADVVVEAIGSSANVEWLAGNGLDLTDGVLTDNHLRAVGAADIYAVGDLARFPNPLFDNVPRRIEHWNIPSETARHAARQIAASLKGETQSQDDFRPLPTFWSDQFGVRVQSFGLPTLATASGGDVRVLAGDLGEEVVVGYFLGDLLAGVIAVGMTAELVSYRDEIMQPSGHSERLKGILTL